MALAHFEDFPVGRVIRHGPRVVTKDEIIAFAAEFDPQLFHLDEEAAKASFVGGLCASGWHTCAILMRLMFDGFLKDSTSLGAPGIEGVKWLRPLRPGERVSMVCEVLDSRLSKSRPEMGLTKFRMTLVTDDGAPIMEQVHTQMFARRDGA